MLTKKNIEEMQEIANQLMEPRKAAFDPMVSEICQVLADSLKFGVTPPTTHALAAVKDAVNFSK